MSDTPDLPCFEDHEEQTGRITVYCYAPSHEDEPWERDYIRRDGIRWLPDKREKVGDSYRIPRRGGGWEWIDAAGRPVRHWDFGRHETEDRMSVLQANWERARAVANVGPDDDYQLGRTYEVRCPCCSDAVRRSDQRLNDQFDALFDGGITSISILQLRDLDKRHQG